MRTRLHAHGGGSRKSTDRRRRTGKHLLAVGIAGTASVAAGAVGVSAALAYSGEQSDAAAQAAEALPDAAPQVTLVQKVMDRVVIRSVRDPKSRLAANGRDLWDISSLGSYDVPSAALDAYKRAAAEVGRTMPACELPWQLLAGIGRVESDHGRYGGSQLGNDGLPRPAIVGIALDGVGPVAAIHDTDGGRWDGDKVWDRAVGPMQFIPGTWESSGRDGDGDGIANPNDIDDAALAAAYYLCPSSGSILPDSAMDAAIRSYNNSGYYVDLVRAFKHGYETGVFVIPSPPPAEGVSADAPEVEPEVVKVDKSGKPVKKGAKPGSKSGGPKGAPKPSKPATPSKPSPSPTKPTQSPKPTESPKPTQPPAPARPAGGTLAPCGETFCVNGVGLDWGNLDEAPPAGFTGETRREALTALAGQVSITYSGPQGVVVAKINGKTW